MWSKVADRLRRKEKPFNARALTPDIASIQEENKLTGLFRSASKSFKPPEILPGHKSLPLPKLGPPSMPSDTSAVPDIARIREVQVPEYTRSPLVSPARPPVHTSTTAEERSTQNTRKRSTQETWERSTQSSSAERLMQDTYDKCSELYSHALDLSDGQGTLQDALQIWHDALRVLYEYNHNLHANYRPRSETEKTLQFRLRVLERNCKSRVENLEDLSRDQSRIAHHLLSETQMVSPETEETLNARMQGQELLEQNHAKSEAIDAMWAGDRDTVAAKCGLTIGHSVLAPGSTDSLIVCGHLGIGSLGVVEEVRIPRPGFESFVRKRVRIPPHQRTQRLKIIQAEAKVLGDLCHLHIVQMLGSYEDLSQGRKEFYCLLMSPVGENDLKIFLDEAGERGLALKEASWLRSWFGCLTSALVYMHGQGIRHQDIKPSNIVHRGSQVLFTDFSSSSRFTIGQTTSTENPARISAMYAAPEVFNNFVDGTLRKHGRKADIFSLGCVFSEMLSVLNGKSVDDFHKFLWKHPGHGNAAEPGNVYLYSRATNQTPLWFKGTPGWPTFERLIAPMICLKQEERCNAHSVVRNLSSFSVNLGSCRCKDQGRSSITTVTRTSQITPMEPDEAVQSSPDYFALPNTIAWATDSETLRRSMNPFHSTNDFHPTNPFHRSRTGSNAFELGG
ncbi:kinase-like protein [Lophium mytilinum]|uniref:Kinase-like protein n=1 Tax=Lophium mytilinum TaxID=390894 RepID=A0A6A6QL50_9PEZI|nr:kinase-like protein [Lophium mytilinum]